MVDRKVEQRKEKTELGTQKKVTFFGVMFSPIDMFLLGTIGIILLLQLHLQFTQKINWDEFFYLSHIYDAQSGRLNKMLQMGHVYLFRWLIFMPGGEMVQITIGRLVMWLAQLGTLALIVKTARHFIPMTYALFAALCFLGLGFVFIHGTSFRADPLAGLCMMMAIYVLAASELQRKHLIFLAVALALGAFVTIKVILFIPLLAVLALWRLITASDKKTVFIRFSGTLLASIVSFLAALGLHSFTLSMIDSVDSTRALSSTAETVFLSGGLFPTKDIMKVNFFTGMVSTVMVVLGIVIAIIYAIKDRIKDRLHLIMIAFALPLLSFLFYRNAYPYFYAYIFPSAIILAGYAAYQLKLSKLLMAVLSVFIFCGTALSYTARFDETRDVQAQTLTAVHQIFPEPVSYFDRNGMIASFPKAGFFMSSWGLRNYTKSGKHKFIHEMETKTIPLLIDNSPAISAALKGESTSLSAEDANALRENYIPHWGHIWVAGKTLSLTSTISNFSILVPGDYTLSASNSVSVNGKLYSPGDTIKFNRGLYEIESGIAQKVVLRWGHHLSRPTIDPIAKPIFGPF